MEELKKIGSLTPTEERVIWNTLSRAVPQPPDLSKRYDEAVTLIAAFNPLLGFQLRSKDYISKIGGIIAQIETQAGQSISMLSEMETQIYRAAIPHINEVVVDLSRRHGLFTGFQIRRYLKKTVAVPKEAEDLIVTLKAEIEKAKNAEVQSTQAQIPSPK